MGGPAGHLLESVCDTVLWFVHASHPSYSHRNEFTMMIRSSLTTLQRRPSVMRAHATNASRRHRRRPTNSTSKKSNAVRKESTATPTLVVEPTLSQPIAWYSRKLDTHPLITKSVTSGLVAGCGDGLGQYNQHCKQREKQPWNWDMLRTGRFVLLGAALVAPVCHLWYANLMTRFPGSTGRQIAKRVVLDQFFFAPLFLPTWLLNLWMLEGRSADYVLEEMPRTLPKAVVANWQLWIPAQTVNLGFIPSKYQVLFSNIVAVAWNAYLSLTTHSNDAEMVSASEDVE